MHRLHTRAWIRILVFRVQLDVSLVHSRRSRVRYRAEHSKIKFGVSTRSRVRYRAEHSKIKFGVSTRSRVRYRAKRSKIKFGVSTRGYVISSVKGIVRITIAFCKGAILRIHFNLGGLRESHRLVSI